MARIAHCSVDYCGGLGFVEMRKVDEPEETHLMCNGHADWYEDQGLAVEVGTEADIELLEDSGLEHLIDPLWPY